MIIPFVFMKLFCLLPHTFQCKNKRQGEPPNPNSPFQSISLLNSQTDSSKHVLRFTAIAVERRNNSSFWGGGGSEAPVSRDRGTARTSQGPRGRAQPPARRDEAIRLRHGDTGELPQTTLYRATTVTYRSPLFSDTQNLTLNPLLKLRKE